MPDSSSPASRPKIILRETIDVAESAAHRVEEKVHKVVSASTGKLRSDPYIWGIYLMLLLVSVIELYSASSTEVQTSNVYSPLIRHGRFLIIGLGLVLLHQRIHYKAFKKYAGIVALGSLVLLIATSYIGVNINGAQRAIVIAGNTIQPAEIVKLTVVVALATVLAKNQMAGGVTNKGVVISAIIVCVFCGVLYKNGLTNAALLMGVSTCMFLVGGIQMKKLLMVFVVYGIAFGFFMALRDSGEEEFDAAGSNTELVASKEVNRDETRGNRFSRWLNPPKPDDPITDINRQEIFSRFAMANGGIIGKGPGNSRESARLPLAFSDYIYSIIVEDTGLVGGIILLLLYIFLLFRAGVVARKCSRAFPALLIMGCAVMIVLQALVHMAIVTGLAPVSGQPLPLISKGGTSVVIMSMALGMMLSVSRYAVTSGNKKEIAAELRELPEDMQAANPTYIDPTEK